MKNETQKTDKETISKKDSLNQAYDPMVGHPKRKLILAVMCLSLIVTVLDNSILNVAIPTISETLKANETDLIWIIDAYTIVFAGLLLTCGTLGDKFGRRLALQSGLFIFGAASFASSFASSPLQLTMGRAIMGIGGALIMPATLSIITNVFPPKERGKAIGVWAAFAGVGVAIGPLTGGFLLEHFWWGSVFMVNVPFVVGGIIKTRRLYKIRYSWGCAFCHWTVEFVVRNYFWGRRKFCTYKCFNCICHRVRDYRCILYLGI